MEKADLELVKQAAAFLKQELTGNAPKKSSDKAFAVRVHNFGTFKIKVAAARKARNPKTGESTTVPERIVVKFSASKTWLAEIQ